MRSWVRKSGDLIATLKQVDKENFDKWIVSLNGPKDTPYEGYILQILVLFTLPSDKPKCRFLNRVFHPHINSLGEIRLCDPDWSPNLRFFRVCRLIPALLESAWTQQKRNRYKYVTRDGVSAVSPLSPQALFMIQKDRSKAFEIARRMTEKHCEKGEI